MNRKQLDGSTLAECTEAIGADRTLDDPGGLLHVDTEYFGRLLQLPTVKPVTSDSTELNVWSVDRLDGVL